MRPVTRQLTTRCASRNPPAFGANGAAAADAADAIADAADGIGLKFFFFTANEPTFFAQLLGTHTCWGVVTWNEHGSMVKILIEDADVRS